MPVQGHDPVGSVHCLIPPEHGVMYLGRDQAPECSPLGCPDRTRVLFPGTQQLLAAHIQLVPPLTAGELGMTEGIVRGHSPASMFIFRSSCSILGSVRAGGVLSAYRLRLGLGSAVTSTWWIIDPGRGRLAA